MHCRTGPINFCTNPGFVFNVVGIVVSFDMLSIKTLIKWKKRSLRLRKRQTDMC